MAAQYRTMNRGGSSIYEEVRKAGYEPWVVGFSFLFLDAERYGLYTGWITSDSTIFDRMIVSMGQLVRLL